jgi:drug/metabolite transporter (DMT)-like permease
MMRNIFSLVFLLPLVIGKFGKVAKTSKTKMHLLRGLTGFLGMVSWFYAITLIPISEAVSISFIVPIITTLAAMFFLKEKVSKKIWLSLAIGFIGVVIIIRPGFRDFNTAYLLAILAPFIWSTSNILVKKLVATESPETIILYSSSVILILSIIVSVPYLKAMSLTDILWFVVLGLASNYTYIANAKCYVKSDISVVQPFDFSRLIFTAIISYFIFDEKLDLIMLLGAIVILLGSILVIPRQSKISRYKKKF